MQAKIKNVIPGEIDESESPPVICTFECVLVLKNNQEIILHRIDNDLRDFIGKEGEFLIYAEGAFREKPLYELSGKFIRKYIIDPKKIEKYVMSEHLAQWGITRESLFEKYDKGIPVILTENGEFHITDNESYKDGELMTIKIDRFHLHPYYIID